MNSETAARMASLPSSVSSRNFWATDNKLASGHGWNLGQNRHQCELLSLSRFSLRHAIRRAVTGCTWQVGNMGWALRAYIYLHTDQLKQQCSLKPGDVWFCYALYVFHTQQDRHGLAKQKSKSNTSACVIDMRRGASKSRPRCIRHLTGVIKANKWVNVSGPPRHH
jgi:hypothetical protein